MKHWIIFLLVACPGMMQAQKKTDPVYVDKEGVMRWTKDRTEASFFGVNYTVPFAYGYRSHKALGIDHEKAIDADVNHMSRLGLDAFRVHVWDVEISDSLGNLLDNEHLRLFDYLLKKLKEKNIKIFITPIAFWGNGYPEPDIRTNGFSYVYGKGGSVVKEEAFRAQENYLKQFFTHVNPYTKLKYKDDPDVIAMEINNEPHHSGPKERTTEYVNRMAAAVRSTGWTKPVFYNISESPSYADAVVRANVDGHSFQWYPTGLVAGREVKGNVLPNVGVYHIPFGDTIPAFRKRAKMVYEFDAGDIMQPVMYPAMARSYRTAGFQWATQFAYDPFYTAYGNTEYQTHYLNLVYTPAKAISLLIASKIFHHVPRGKNFGGFPSDTLFDGFRISYKQQLSEMNTDESFYHTGSTTTVPRNISGLKHVAGVGSSPVVEYEGRGAYFLDKKEEGIWLLEVYPDAIPVKDPFERASPKKEVTLIEWNSHRMKINIPGWGGLLTGGGMDEPITVSAGENFFIRPGIYMIRKPGSNSSVLVAGEFYAPPASVKEPVVVPAIWQELTAGIPFVLQATIAGADAATRISLELRNSSNQWKTVAMEKSGDLEYKAVVPADILTPGLINYRMIVRKANGDTYTFPGGFKGNPYAWDEWRNESWQSLVMAPGAQMELFNATQDRNKVNLYNTDWRNNRVEYVATEEPRLALKTTMTKPVAGQLMGWQFFFGEKIGGRKSELSSYSRLVIRARAKGTVNTTISLIDADASSYAASLPLSSEWKTIEIPLRSFRKDSMLLLPRPYPGFQKLWFMSTSDKVLDPAGLEKLELRFETGTLSPAGVEVQWIRLKK